MTALRLGVLVKQIPAFEAMVLGPDGRLLRDGLELELNPYCRRAVAQAVAIAQTRPGSTVTVLTLGPPAAEDALRESIAWGLERGVVIRGVLVSDPAFAGSDTLATAKALAAAIGVCGSFDAVFLGRNSVDADTGQVGPEVAELLDLPFLTGVRHLDIAEDGVVNARCEHDDGWVQLECSLPVVVSCAERLIDPAKVDSGGRAAVPAALIERLDTSHFGPGPWGAAASPTWVGRVRVMDTQRSRQRWPDLPVAEQVARAVAILHERGALSAEQSAALPAQAPVVRESSTGRPIAVLAEPNRWAATQELLGEAARLGGPVTVVLAAGDGEGTEELLSSSGADAIVRVDGPNVEELVASAVTTWARGERPWAILSGSTAWGREVSSRIAAALDVGLTGDAIELEADGDRLIAWKPAFGGQLVAAVGSLSTPQMVTIRAGVLPHWAPRSLGAIDASSIAPSCESRVRILARTRDDDLEVLADAATVIGIGRGVDPAEYDGLEPLRVALGAELGATRKVTDNGWLPRARQIGITGRSIAPRLFVSIGANGKFNHMVGVRGAGSVLAINPDVGALVFDAADVGIVADWHDVIEPFLVELERLRVALRA